MRFELREAAARTRVLVMVSKFAHCLNDLLFRTRIGDLPAEIVAVVSNHPDHRDLVEWHGIPFFHVPVTAATKPEAEAGCWSWSTPSTSSSSSSPGTCRSSA